jgi:hypothetical protein
MDLATQIDYFLNFQKLFAEDSLNFQVTIIYLQLINPLALNIQ